jgi:hypothetical protein
MTATDLYYVVALTTPVVPALTARTWQDPTKKGDLTIIELI